MRNIQVWLVLVLLAQLGCDGGAAATKGPLRLSPASATLLPGMVQTLEVDGLAEADLVWNASAGSLTSHGSRAQLVAPSEAGDIQIRVTRRSEPAAEPLLATVHVVTAKAGALELTQVSEDAITGVRGSLGFTVSSEGSEGARARFELADEAIEVRVIDGAHAELTLDGITLDGEGALLPKEEAALRGLVSAGYFPDVALVGLDLACADAPVAPPTLAALLFPLQLVHKYLTLERRVQTLGLAQASACRYYTQVLDMEDSRPLPTFPLLSNGQYVPFAVGYLPLDEHGALGEVGGAKAQPLVADEDVYGPGDSMCRGACGADCEKNNCGEPRQEWRCVKRDGQNTGEKVLWESYTCGEHPGCIEHDACFDNCNTVFGFDSWNAAFCMRGCDMQAAAGYGADQGVEWAQGYGPYTHEKTYDYSLGDPIYDEKACPLDFSLVAVPSSGLAPHATTLRWSGALSDTGTERCRLDLGDGSPLVDIDPCKATGEYAHIYGVPSEMRKAQGTYTATLTRIGAAQSVSTDVQARFRFDATPATGEAPLATSFSWDGFRLVDKTLTCTLDFGDGSASQTIQNCGKSTHASHIYAAKGVYVARLTVRGEDRPVTKTLSIEVRGPRDQPERDFADVLRWQLDYSITNNSDHAWSELGGVQVNRSWTETEQGTLVLRRTSVSDRYVTLEGEGEVSSSIDFKKVEASQYFSEERWDKGQGTSTVRVSVSMDTELGTYDVYISCGDFSAQYGGSRSSADGSSSMYGPENEMTHVEPAPIIATGELTRTLPSQGLTITGSYTWDAFFAYESENTPGYDVNEAWKKGHKSGTTEWTLTPLAN